MSAGVIRMHARFAALMLMLLFRPSRIIDAGAWVEWVLEPIEENR